MKIKQKLALIIGCLALLLLTMLLLNSPLISHQNVRSLLLPSELTETQQANRSSEQHRIYLRETELLAQLGMLYSELPVVFSQAHKGLISAAEFTAHLRKSIETISIRWEELNRLSRGKNGQLAPKLYRYIRSQKRVVRAEIEVLLDLVLLKSVPLHKAIDSVDIQFYSAIGAIVMNLNQHLALRRIDSAIRLETILMSAKKIQAATLALAIVALLLLGSLSWITLRNLIHPLRALVNLATGLASQEEKRKTREGAYKDYHSAVNKVGQYVEFQAGWHEEIKVTIGQYAKGKYADVKMAQQDSYHPDYAPKNWVLPHEYVESMKVIEQLRGRLVNMHQEIQHLSNANLQREYNYRFSANDS